MRSKTASFVVTVSALTACVPQKSNEKPPETTPDTAPTTSTTPVPQPEPQPTAETPPTEDASTVTATVDAEPAPENLGAYPKVLNPRDAQGRTIKKAWQGAGCYVELPFPPLLPGQQRYPGTPPPSQNVTCPASMNDPAYEQCRGGVVHQNPPKSACVCFVMGNPPPPPKRIGCPK
jgi:hypothetical protein